MNFYNEIDELLKREDQKDYSTRLLILATELGDALKSGRYYNYYKGDPKIVQANKLRFETDLSDLIAQCMVMCRFVGLYYEDVQKLGIERLREYLEHSGFSGDK